MSSWTYDTDVSSVRQATKGCRPGAERQRSAEHAALFTRIGTWLKPGGWFLASLGAAEDPDWTGSWLGVSMFFSSFDADTNLALLKATGLRIDAHEVATLHEPEPEGDARFLWVIAQRPMA